jgi:glycosyltransferase involved in cell wall biosynthesis
MTDRVLFLSGREVEYMRNRVLLSALSKHFEVTVLTPKLPGTTRRLAAGLSRFLTHHPGYDVCFAGFYGQPIAVALSALQRKPIILDAYISTFDTLCEDRRRFDPNSLVGRLAYWLDLQSCEVASLVLTDTQAQSRYFTEKFGILPEKLRAVYVGCDESLFYPRDNALAHPRRVEVFYYGAFLPLHGTEIIVRAAALLRDRPEIHFILGGDGVRRGVIQEMVSKLALDNVELVGWIPVDELPDYISRASICLGGHFSTIPKAARVISTKTFQFLAMRKPTIVADNPATREILVHGKHAWLIPMGDASALATAIKILADDTGTRRNIECGGYELFQKRLTTATIADQLTDLIGEVICAFAS